MVLAIVHHGNPVLREVAKEVAIPEITSQYIKDIIESVNHPAINGGACKTQAKQARG